jgi:hypothetical protein
MKPATGIGLAALALAAAGLYLHRGGPGPDVQSAHDGLGAGAGKIPGSTLPRAEHAARVEEQLRDAGARAASKEPQADPFGDAHQAAAVVALATNDPNVTRSRIGNLIMTLDTAVSAAKAQAKTPTDTEMVGFYADALDAYRDGLQFWELRRFADRPGQNSELDALAAKYDIQPVKAISYTATWQTYPDAYLKIWALANAATTKGNELYDH